jgi:hypothetical protein
MWRGLNDSLNAVHDQFELENAGKPFRIRNLYIDPKINTRKRACVTKRIDHYIATFDDLSAR